MTWMKNVRFVKLLNWESRAAKSFGEKVRAKFRILNEKIAILFYLGHGRTNSFSLFTKFKIVLYRFILYFYSFSIIKNNDDFSSTKENVLSIHVTYSYNFKH